MTRKEYFVRGLLTIPIILIIATGCIGIWIVMNKKLYAYYFLTPRTPPPTAEVMNKVESQLALISDSYGYYGSGCQIMNQGDDQVVLASRHQVGNVALDKLIGIDVDIFINDKKARILKYSATLGDIVFLTTNLNHDPPIDNSVFSKSTPVINQAVYTKGHPSDITNLFQAAKIVKIEKNQHGFTELTISGDFVEVGISGSCIYDTDGYIMGVIKKKENIPPHIAIVTVVNSY